MDNAPLVGYSLVAALFRRPSSASVKSVCKLCLPLAAGSSRWMHLGAGTLQTMTQELIEELRAWISYDPDTGILTWKKSRKGARAGDVCGGPHSNGYIRVGFNYKRLFAHRIAFALYHGRPPFVEVDHINRIKTDNRIQNLREATKSENTRNGSLRSNNSSGVQGVSWSSYFGRWRAQVRGGPRRPTRYFRNLNEAADWVRQKRAELHGEFAV